MYKLDSELNNPETLGGLGMPAAASASATRTSIEPALAGLDLWVENGRLRYRSKGDALSGPLRSWLVEHKDEILQRVPEGRIYPLSFAQQRLWFLEQLQPEGALYNIGLTLRLKGRLRPEVLQAALNGIVRRHDALRTRFLAVESQPVQVVEDRMDLGLPIADLARLSPSRRRQELTRLAHLESRRPFDLARGPLLRVLAVRLEDEDHLLSATMHHIISDGWSMGVLVHELGAFYGSFCANRPASLPPLPAQYPTFARWQRTWLAESVIEGQIEYWKEKLAGVPPLALPADRPRPARPTHRGGLVKFSWPSDLTRRLADAARRQDATLYMALLAAFQALLGRCTGQSDFSVGTPIANRNQPEVEGLIGFFVNTLVMRAGLSGRPSFRQLINRARDTALEAYSHQDVPFEQVVEALHPERSLSRSPLFQVMFVLQNAPAGSLQLPGLQASSMESDTSVSRFDLTLAFSEGGQGLEGTVIYSRDLFEEPTIERLLGHYRNLSEAALEHPEQWFETLAYLSAEEEKQLLEACNATARDYPREASVAQVFEGQVAERPDSLALLSDESQLSYGELDRQSDWLAACLRGKGAGPESLLGIFAERSLEMVLGLLGILKACAAYLPLDPEYPQERLALMMEDARLGLVLTQQRLAARLPEGGPRAFCLDAPWSPPSALSAQPPRTLPENLAYVMYTSGSTGRPKGVSVTQRGVVRLVQGTEYALLGSEQCFLQMATISFDASTFQIWGALLNGARLVLFPPRKPTLEELDRIVARHGITMLGLPAALFRLISEHTPETLQRVRQVLAGGDVLSATHARQALKGGLKRLINAYGPTENTTYTCCHVMERPDPGVTVPIGRPIANTTVYVLDRHFNLVPQGVAGELFTGGDGLARGYLGRPHWSAERFVPHPFAAGERLYRTGDLVRRRREGVIEFLGRMDHQAKIRGFRVEPGEIEAALCKHPEVREAAVILRGEAADEKRLVAYVVGRTVRSSQLAVGRSDPDPESDSSLQPAAWSLTPQSLRRFLEERLPDYMVPSAFVTLDFLPLTPNGKLDRKALPFEASAGVAEASGAPAAAGQELLAGIMGDVLGVEGMGARSNFFELGGHSLMATQVISRIRKAFQVELPLRALFEAPTAVGLFRQVEEARLLGRRKPVPPLQSMQRPEMLPLSFAQQRLWFLDQLAPGSPLYNIPMSVRLRGELKESVLEAALSEIVRRHEVLRTRFPSISGRPVQVVAEHSPLRLPLADLSGLPNDLADIESQRLIREEAGRPFDLSQGPLLRLGLVRLGEGDHLLAAVVHHIVSDAWSTGIWIAELSALYEAFGEGLPSPLPDLPVQYADFALWQRDLLVGGLVQEQLDYWKERLQGAPALELPADHPRPARYSERGATQSFVLPHALHDSLRELSKRSDSTLYMTLLAAFQALLHRCSGQDDISVGSPIANRNQSETEGLIGFFVNTQVIRIDLSGRPSFQELLSRVRSASLQAHDHQDVPFEQVVEALDPERNMGRTPLFQALFTLQNPVQVERLSNLDLIPLPVEASTSKFDLMLSLQEAGPGQGLWGAVEYSSDLFEAPTVRRLTRHFRRLLEGLTAHPDRPVAEPPLMSAAERHQLLREWNATRSGYPAQALLTRLFEGQAARRPDSAAVDYGGRHLSYGELNLRANQLARLLQSRGAGLGVPVGLMAARSPEMVLGTLAILKAGAAYLPLDPSYPQERLSFMLDDTGAPIVLAQQASLQNLPAEAPEAVVLERDWESLQQQPAADPALSQSAWGDHLAYVIYTSGSTGLPKGVAVTHRGVARLVLGTDYVQLGPADRLGQVANHSFDAATFEIWGALLNGGCIAGLSYGEVVDLDTLARRLAETQVSAMFLTAALFNRVAESLPRSFRAVSHLLVGGEALDPRWVRRVLGCGPPLRLLNGYGPTECTTFAVCRHIRQVTPQAVSIPIGRPIANTSAWLLDSEFRPVPIGVAGELFLGGAGLARGYLNRPALTAERFVPHFWGRGERLYRTGDRVRRLADGAIDFLGRFDDQVKIRGFRIEPGEIEFKLSQYPAVSTCAVLALADGAGQKRLVAYAASPWEPLPTAAELHSFLQEELPAYMVPSAFVILGSLPLTPNGKVDRKALPREAAAVAAADYQPPATPSEELLSGIWSGLLGVERVSRQDSFFNLGGHSLLATQVVSRLRKTFGIELPLRALFEAPTLAGLARRIDEAGLSGTQQAAPPLARASREGRLPLSYAQQRLWFLDQLDPGSPVYNIPSALRLKGPLDKPALRSAFSEVERRHEILRTSFPAREGRPYQSIQEPGELEFPEIDLGGCPEACREQELERLRFEEGQRTFDLENDRMIRLKLVRMGDQDHALLATLHHIAMDGWSVGILMNELDALYGAFSTGRPSPLAELPVQYADFADWQRRWLSGSRLEELLGYWKKTLSGAPSLDLPVDRPRPARLSNRGHSVAFDWPSELLTRFQELAKRLDATLFMALLASFQAVLGRYSGLEDFSVGTPIANRNRAEIEGLVGFFVNTLVLRADLSGDPSFSELIARVRETALGAYAHQDVPFERVVEALQPERSLSRSPLFQAMFVLQNVPSSEEGISGLEVVPFESKGTATSKFDLTVAAVEREGALGGVCEYSTDLFEPATIRRMLGHWQNLAEQMLQAPEQPLSSFSLMGEQESRQVLQQWSVNRTDYPRAATVPDLFRAQAERRPDAVAVVDGDAQLSYGHLDRRAGELARFLNGQGVGPESLVGVFLHRCMALVESVLGIVQAGAAYLPLDPEYPVERLGFMLEDASVGVVLTCTQIVERLPAWGPQCFCLDRDWGRIEQAGPSAALQGLQPENRIYVIYTSGSTGLPKGVEIPHRGVVRLTKGSDYARLDSRQTFLLLTPFTFDVSTFELWGCLLHGGRLAVYPSEKPALGRLGDEIRRQGVTTLWLTAPLFHLMVDQNPQGLRSVRQLLAGGDALSADHVGRALQAGADCVIDGYGPTECTTFACCSRMESVDPDWPSVPIGGPIANTSAYVLDSRGAPLPVGVPGELCLGGDGLARAYLNRPRLTAERFVPDPFGKSERLYRTGDRVRWRRDASLEFLGRLDHQVKIRGFRVEPGEVEALLSAHPQVSECAVVPRPDAAGNKRLVAYAACDGQPPPSAAELQGFLAEQLPDYMVPSAFVLLDELPSTSSGKIDRKALPQEALQSTAEFVVPRTPAEETLAGIWREVLGVERVGVRDNFFELGGHSLLATQAVAQLGKAFGFDLPVRTLFEAPTVAEMARLLEGELPIESSPDQAPLSPLVALKKSGSSKPFFCVHPAGGSVTRFVHLSRHLGEDRPFYGLQAPDLYQGEEPCSRVEDLADRYLQSVRERQQQGPYLLGGHSFGGLVAYEMACRLHEGGEEVALLALIDSSLTTGKPAGPGERASMLASFALSLGVPVQGFSWELLAVGSPDEQLAAILDRARQMGLVRPEVELEQFRRLFRVLQAHVEASWSYRPRPCPVRACLFWADSPLDLAPGHSERGPATSRASGALAESLSDQSRQWRRLVEGLEVFTVPGDHFSMLEEPHVRVLAEQIVRQVV